MTDYEGNYYGKQFQRWQAGLMIARQVQLGLGCVALLYIIGLTLYKKHYVYNTTKLFMFFSICQFIGMFVVLIHLKYLTADYLYVYSDYTCFNKQNIKQNHTTITDHVISNVLRKMKKQRVISLCALEAFINLFAYNLGYFFAVLITYNVYCVINQCNRNFMKSVFKSPKVIGFLIFLFIIFLAPFILSVSQQYQGNKIFYQYGPDGFPFQIYDYTLSNLTTTGWVTAKLIFLCGMVYNQQSTSVTVLALINSYICPFSLFVIHFWFLRKNRKSMNTIQKSQYLNSKQLFILKSGKVSLVVFIIQGLSFLKTIVAILLHQVVVSIVLNYLFDLYPFVILYFYIRYTQQKKGLRNSSTSILTDE